MPPGQVHSKLYIILTLFSIMFNINGKIAYNPGNIPEISSLKAA
jgi:hypothetical protein